MVGNQDTADGSNDVRINYIRYEAQAPSCGDWSTNLAETSANLTSPNFGCATQKNLAAMVARPGDMVLGRGNADTTDTMGVAGDRIRSIIEALSLEIATPDEAREILKLKGGANVGF